MSSNQLTSEPVPGDLRSGETRVFRRRSDVSSSNELPPDLDRADLVSLLRTELRHLWRNGETVFIEQFRTQLQRAGATENDWLSLIGTEIQLRRECGQFPELEEYVRRFPELTGRLPDAYNFGAHHDENAHTQVDAAAKNESMLDGSFAGKTMRQKVSTTDLDLDDLDLRIPGYQILSVLGRGGMGVVYQARQTGLNRVVALKMILSGCHADKEDRARFVQEAEAVAALRHPCIVQVYEIGEHEGKPFFSMEYVDGGTLAHHIKGQPQSPAFVANIGEQLALAVHSAHDQNIIHRDLKPANILLSGSGRPSATASQKRTKESDDTKSDLRQQPATLGTLPKITDFGLAKRLDTDVQLTTNGLVAGTPQYMAPEQVSAARQDLVGPAADVWSLGVIQYEMLTGRPPFLGSNPAEIMHQVLRQEPVAIRQLQPKVPRDLETICLRCLQKEPHKRYPSAQALAADLRRFQNGQPILARPVGILEQFWRWCRRNPAVATLIAVVAVTLSAGVLVATNFAIAARNEARRAEHHSRNAEQLGERNRIAAEELRVEKITVVDAHQKLSDTFIQLTKSHEAVMASRKEEERLKNEAEQREKLRARELYDAQMTLAQRAWDMGHVPRTRRLLAAYEPVHHDQEDLRGFEWFYLDRISNAEGMRYSIPDGCRSVTISPDGTRIAWAFRNVCEVWKLQTPSDRIMVIGANPKDRHQSVVERVTFDPSGKYLATASRDCTIKVWEANSGKLVHTLTTGSDSALGLRFSADGTALAAVVGNDRFSWHPGEVRVWDSGTGQLKYTSKGHQGLAYDVSWSPDGSCYATAGHDSSVKIWDAKDGKLLRTLSLPPQSAGRSVAFAANGPLLAAGTTRGEVVVWSRDDWKEQRVLRGHVNWVSAVAFAANGRMLASGGSDMLLKIWDAGTGEEFRTYRGHSSYVVSVAWHPTQPFAFSAAMDESIRGWNVNTDPEQFVIRSLGGNLTGFHLLPDGRHIAVAGQRAFVGIWDVMLARTVRAIPVRDAPLGYLWSSTLSPDGSTQAFARCHEQDDDKGAVFAWSFANQESRNLELPCLYPGIRAVVYSPDGKSLATGHRDGTVQIHDLSGSAPPRTWQAHASPIHQLVFEPGDNGRLLTLGIDKTPRLWNTATGAEISRFAGHAQAVRNAAFSKDGRLLATASDDLTARIWDVKTGKTLLQLEGHIGPVTCVAFSPNADRLVTGSDDFTLKLWDLKTGHEALTLRGHTMGLIQVAFAPDGRRILSSAQDETVRVWHAGVVSDRELLRAAAAACRLTGFSVEGKPQAGQELQAKFELANVSGKEWPTPPPRKSIVPFRTVMRLWADPIATHTPDSKSSQLVGRYEWLPTSTIAPDFKMTAQFPVSLAALEGGKYRLRLEHGWIGDEVLPISEKTLDIEVAANPNAVKAKKVNWQPLQMKQNLR